jgi:hypothetical protein
MIFYINRFGAFMISWVIGNAYALLSSKIIIGSFISKSMLFISDFSHIASFTLHIMPYVRLQWKKLLLSFVC